MKVLMIYPNLKGIATPPPIGFTSLCTYIQQNTRHRIEVFDCTFRRRSWAGELRELLGREQFGAVGIQAHILDYEGNRRVYEVVRNSAPGVPVIVGGVHPTLLPHDVISIDEVDAICRGEGEESLAEYLDRLESGDSMEGVAGIWFKQDGRVVENPLRPPPRNLDDLPFPNYDFWRLPEYFRLESHFSVIAGRGCPHGCTFCHHNAVDNLFAKNTFRTSSPDKLVEEMIYQREKYATLFDIRGFFIQDDSLTSDRDWLSRLCARMIDTGLSGKTRWVCNGRIADMDRDTLRMMAQAGCYYIQVGVESAEDSTRRKYGKAFDNEEVREVFDNCRKLGISLRAYFITNSPYESQEGTVASVRMALDLRPDLAVLQPFIPIPGSSAGQEILEKDPEMYWGLQSILMPYQKGRIFNPQFRDTLYVLSGGMQQPSFFSPIKTAFILMWKLLFGTTLDRLYMRALAYNFKNWLGTCFNMRGIGFLADLARFGWLKIKYKLGPPELFFFTKRRYLLQDALRRPPMTNGRQGLENDKKVAS